VKYRLKKLETYRSFYRMLQNMDVKSIQKRIQNVKKVTRIKERTLVNIE